MFVSQSAAGKGRVRKGHRYFVSKRETHTHTDGKKNNKNVKVLFYLFNFQTPFPFGWEILGIST